MKVENGVTCDIDGRSVEDENGVTCDIHGRSVKCI